MLADAKADAIIVFFCQHAIYLGYDKLKPFGFPIHGAINSYSRKILWLEVARSNNKPEIPASFFFECLRNTLAVQFFLELTVVQRMASWPQCNAL